jgi:cytochrome P450
LAFLAHLSQTYGDVAAFRLGPERVVLLTHPDHIHGVLVTHHRNFVKGRRGDVSKQFLGEGLLNSEGTVHRRQRRLTQPAFHHQRLSSYAAIMRDHAVRLCQRWRHGATLDIAPAMTELTLAIVCETLFHVDIEPEANAISSAINTLMQLSPRFSLPFAALLTKLPLPSNVRLQRAQQLLDTIIYRIIHERRAAGTDRGDLLSMLLLAQDESALSSGMTDKQVHDEALTLLLAGHETTATALTWTWYLLSQHPAVEAALHRELDTVLAGRLPTVDDLPHLVYTRLVFTEALRLYPPAWLMTRRAQVSHQIGDYTLPAGSFILISPYITHHDARFFPEPEAFQPQRWDNAKAQTHSRFAFFPFGAGPRQCVGEGFAWMEGILVLATLAQQWHMRLVPDHPIALHPLVTLRSKYGMPMTLRRR